MKIRNLITFTIALAFIVACSSSPDPSVQSTSESVAPALIDEASVAKPTSTPVSNPAPTAAPTAVPAPIQTPDSSPVTSKEQEGKNKKRSVGDYEGVAFSVAEGSKISFSVTEQLFRLSSPIDAVLTTSKLEGNIFLDGRESIIEMDLHSLTSDSSSRDRYVKRRMFPDNRTAILEVPPIETLPKGFETGVEVSTKIASILKIKGNDIPVDFDIVAIDSGDHISITGKTVVTWDQLKMPVPTARAVLSLEDEIRVEVKLQAFAS